MPEPSAYLYTAEFGKHQVKDQQIRIFVKRCFQSCPSVKSSQDVISFMLQFQFKEPCDLLFIFNNENGSHLIIPF